MNGPSEGLRVEIRAMVEGIESEDQLDDVLIEIERALEQDLEVGPQYDDVDDPDELLGAVDSRRGTCIIAASHARR